MSVEQAQRTVNQINKDIADLEKKMADKMFSDLVPLWRAKWQ